MTIDPNQSGALTLESVRKLLASASDETHTQLRVTTARIAFISSTDVGSENTDGLAFRLETFCQGNDYVGAAAANDDEWVGRIYRVLQKNWPNPSDEFIDLFSASKSCPATVVAPLTPTQE